MMQHWAARPGLARFIRFAVAVAPVALTLIVTATISRFLLPPAQGWERLGWWLILTIIAVAVMTVLDRLFRRLAPLSTLLRISLIFPDEAPSRFAVALRAGNTKMVQKRIATIQESGIALNEDESYASQMLELVAVLSEHDRLTRGHCERVRAYTELIIEEMGLPVADAERLRWAALLHDLGKLMVPAEILNKDGRPTDAEWEILKTHPAEGVKLAAPIAAWLGEWLGAIGEHHERWDGDGYPSGLAGYDIHLGARIVSVADTYDVITSPRSYKKPISAEYARAEIARCAGSQFDPAVVRAFLSVGIGRLRFIAGPMAWLSGSVASLPGAGVAPIAASSVAAAAALVSTAVFVPVQPRVGIDDVAFADPTEISSTTTTSGTGPTFVVTIPPDGTTPEDSVPAPVGSVTTLTSSSGASTTVTSEIAVVTTGADSPSGTAGPTPTTATTAQASGPGATAGLAPTPPTTARPTTTTTPPTTTTTVPPTSTSTTTVAGSTRNDSFTVAEGGSILVDVLANDIGTLTLIGVSGAANARQLALEGGRVRYWHDGGETVSDSFTYSARRSDGGIVSGSVAVTITPVNDDPTVSDQTLNIIASASSEGTVLVLTASDPDHSSHTWTLVGTTNGTFSLVANQLRLNDADQLVPGQTETVQVRARDGGGASSAVAAITITVTAASTTGLLISEFSSNGVNPSGDFVEIYNSSSQARDLDGLRLQITSHNAVLSDNTIPAIVLPPGGFYLFKRSGSGVAGADQTFSGGLPAVVGMALLKANGTQIDAVGTQANPEVGPAGVTSPSLVREGGGVVMLDPNATSTSQSMGRRYGNPGACIDSNSNVADFVHNFASGTVTPRGTSSGTAACGSAPAFAGTSGTVIISEIRTDGPGSGTNDFVEFFNPTGSAILLNGWKMEGSGGLYNFPNVLLQPGQHFLVGGTNYAGPVDDTTANSPKNGGSVDLRNSSGVVVDSITFGPGSSDLPRITRRLLQSYVRKYGCQFSGNDRNDFEHVSFSDPQTMASAPQSCPG